MLAHLFHPDCQLESNKPTKNFSVYYRMHHILSANKIRECFAATKCTPPPAPPVFLNHYPSLSSLSASPPSLASKMPGIACLLTLKGAPPLPSSPSDVCRYIIHIWPDLWQTHSEGDYRRAQREVSSKQGFNQSPHLLHATVKGGFSHCTSLRRPVSPGLMR